ncbi:MAG: P-II family nitrogen regulator [Planctomycetota bacterium]|nr:P-II family nitrogen regulator [Planctomycetota bacterium]
MKLLLIAYNEAVDQEMMERLDACGVTGYTKWTRVLGRGATSGPHLLSHVWPKGNNVLAVAVEDEAADAIFQAVDELRQSAGTEGVKAFVLPIERAT